METYAVAIPAIGIHIAVMYIHVCICSSCPVVQTVELKTTPIPFCFHSMYSSDIRGVCQSRKTITFITEKTQKKKTQWKTDASNALEALSFHGQQSPGKAVLGEFQGNLDLSKPNGSDHLP